MFKILSVIKQNIRIYKLATVTNYAIRFLDTSRIKSIHVFLGTMILKGNIIVYSVVGCPHCMRAKNFLHEKDLPYIDVNLEIYPQCRAFVKERTGKTTVPQIFFNNHHVGGNEELQTLVSDNSCFSTQAQNYQSNNYLECPLNVKHTSMSVKNNKHKRKNVMIKCS